MAIDNAWLDERIAKTKTMIIALEDGITALAAGAQTYSLDTGQTRVSKTAADLGSMRKMLTELESRLDDYCRRRFGKPLISRPGF